MVQVTEKRFKVSQVWASNQRNKVLTTGLNEDQARAIVNSFPDSKKTMIIYSSMKEHDQQKKAFVPVKDQLVLVECDNNITHQNEWKLGNVTGLVAATDRDFRVNVILENGRLIGEAAPECVKPYMRAVKVTYANGDTTTTNINGTDEELKAYYRIGKIFNIGSVTDNLQAVTDLQIIY